MKAIVFGATGFIGGHVVEQLHLAGHQVTAAVRYTSDTSFLEKLGIPIVSIDFSDHTAINKAIEGHEVVYNCTADAKLHSQISLDAPVEIQLTRTLIEAAASQGASRFIQLSTIVIYDFQSNDPMDESYPNQPEYPIQRLGIEREKIVQEIGRKTGITTIVLRPASTIGPRDKASFFARLYAAHAHGQYPILGDGTAKVSLVDTRDIGRAMVWLGHEVKPESDHNVYLLKGYDTTWEQLKAELDHATGRVAQTLHIPENLTEEQMEAYKLTPFAIKTLMINRLWNDAKIRKLGFETKYTLRESVEAAVRDLMDRN